MDLTQEQMGNSQNTTSGNVSSVLEQWCGIFFLPLLI